MLGNAAMSGNDLAHLQFDPKALQNVAPTLKASSVPPLIHLLDRSRGIMERQSALATRLEKATDQLLGSVAEPEREVAIPSPPCAGVIGETAMTLEHMVLAADRIERALERLERALG